MFNHIGYNFNANIFNIHNSILSLLYI